MALAVAAALLCFFLRAAAAAAGGLCSSGDLAALAAFFFGIKIAENNSGTDCCSWRGVSCSGAGDVVGIALPSAKLNGVVSPALAQLEQLRRIDLSSNALHGGVPASLFQLRYLELLDVSDNELSGELPPAIVLPALRVFNISMNSFHGPLPVVSGVANLTVFDAGLNYFTGEVDAGICNSSAGLQTLRLSMNSLTGVLPAGLSRCRALTELAVDFNGIAGELPDDLFQLRLLEALFVQENRLSGRMNAALGNLSNLERLDLSFNAFSGEIPDVFSGLGKLERFAAQSNLLAGQLPLSLASLPSLKDLNLRNNSLSGEINVDCSSAARLRFVDLSMNALTGTVDALSACTELQSLNLARNDLAGAIPDGFRNLRQLSQISLSNNSFVNLSSALAVLQYLPSLTSVVLTKNFRAGEALPADGIHGFRRIQVLVIASCGLAGAVPPWLAGSPELKVLDLSWNRLAGVIPPWIAALDRLFYLDLSNNSLAGDIPATIPTMRGLLVRNRTAEHVGAAADDSFPFFIKRKASGKGLQYSKISNFPPSLILSHNALTGVIPPELRKLKNLHVLDLSSNQLLGTIPVELSEMSSLETLDLSRNRLAGVIPPALVHLTFLSSFSVAYNNLSGEIPSGGQFSTFPSASFDGNPLLCGARTVRCAADGANATAGNHHRSSVILVVALTAGVVLVVLALVVVLVIMSRRQWRKKDHAVEAVGDDERSAPVFFFDGGDGAALTAEDIRKATNNFDEANIIGCGGFGLVYKAALPGGATVAVKRLTGGYLQMEKEFTAEVETLSKARHQNLVLLRGYCSTGSERLLIYSFMENGSLDDWLHDGDGNRRRALSWSRRLKIAQGAARGLAYLHCRCSPHILHRDIKSSNILLDAGFEAHLADFGLARLILPRDTHVTTELIGTLGYIPPEYGHTSVATFRGDVYSFGMVLLELLTGRRPIDVVSSGPKGSRPPELGQWARKLQATKSTAEMFDPAMQEAAGSGEQMEKMAEIACLCISDSPKQRPSSDQVARWLDELDAAGAGPLYVENCDYVHSD